MTIVDDIEVRRQERQIHIDAARTAPERNRLGQFATPPALARQIAARVLSIGPGSGEPIRFLEPSVGSGSFFGALLDTLDGRRVEQALGVEIDPRFAEAATELWAQAGLTVIRGDFLSLAPSLASTTHPNLVLANPPYVRHHHMESAVKAALGRQVLKSTGMPVSGLAGLYVYFLILASELMAEGGVAGWLIPSEFMDVNYGAALRDYLAQRVTLLQIHRFDPADVQFADALVTSAVVIFRKGVPPADHTARFSYGGTLHAPARQEQVTLPLLSQSPKWTVFPRHPDTGSLASVPSESAGTTFADLFRVQRGIATGCDDLFILPRAKARQLQLPEECLRPILPSPRRLANLIIPADADGYPCFPEPWALIQCDLPEAVLRDRHPALWSYFDTAATAEIRARYILRNRNPWYRLEYRPAPPFLCTYMGRGTGDKKPFRFLWNQSQAISTNLYLMVYPIGQLAAALRQRPEAYALVHQFLSSVTGNQLRDAGRVYGGGLHKMEPGELLRVSVAPLLEAMPELHASVHAPTLFG